MQPSLQIALQSALPVPLRRGSGSQSTGSALQYSVVVRSPFPSRPFHLGRLFTRCHPLAAATMIDDVLSQIKASGVWVGAVPEHSAVGSSQSNGRAEGSVQMVEDMVRHA